MMRLHRLMLATGGAKVAAEHVLVREPF